jgi:hypothetical protein
VNSKVAGFVCVVATLLWAFTFVLDALSDHYEVPPGLTGVMAGMASTAAVFLFRKNGNGNGNGGK